MQNPNLSVHRCILRKMLANFEAGVVLGQRCMILQAAKRVFHRTAISMRPRTPDGSQVHRAVGLDGRQLAVKVQHAGLRESGAVDVVTIGTAAKALAWAVPDYNYSWIAEETASNLPLVRALAFHPLAPSHPSPHPQSSCACPEARMRSLCASYK